VPTADTVVFIPAWNEERSLPAVLDELRVGLHDADVLVIDDGSTDATGEVARALGAMVVSFGENRDVAVGSRFAEGEGYGADRYEPSPARRFGIGLLQKAMHIRLGRPFHDPTSGMAAVNRVAMPVMAQPYVSGAPEVEALLRLKEAGLRVEEVAVHMREREHGESKLQGGKAVKLVLTVIGTLLFFRWLRRRRA
jgi:hypothetical protein